MEHNIGLHFDEWLENFEQDLTIIKKSVSMVSPCCLYTYKHLKRTKSTIRSNGIETDTRGQGTAHRSKQH